MSLQHTYGFTATFADGSTIEFEPNGSYNSKEVEGGTLFTDIQNKDTEDNPLISFVLHNDELSWGVDLRDGHFEINGVPFWQHRPELDNYKNFRVIYHFTTQRSFTQGVGEHDSSIIGYNLGWQVSHLGKNVKKMLHFPA